MDVDLYADAQEIHTLLADSVALYLQNREDSPDDHPPVRRIELALLSHAQPPVIAVDFDTRPDVEDDGDATHRCLAHMHRPSWEAFLSLGEHEPVTFTLPDGTEHTADSDAVDRTISAFLVGVLQEARDNGTFDSVADEDGLMLSVTFEGFPVSLEGCHG